MDFARTCSIVDQKLMDKHKEINLKEKRNLLEGHLAEKTIDFDVVVRPHQYSP